jgi:calcineurin-like phosphoesterase family protein
MNETIINNWNEVVNPDDKVFHLGDFCFGDPTPFLEKLNGEIILIKGNHDSHLTKYPERYKKLEIPREGYNIILTHKPEAIISPIVTKEFKLKLITEEADKKSIHIHGHTHQLNTAFINYINVCVENTLYSPVKLNVILAAYEMRKVTCTKK